MKLKRIIALSLSAATLALSLTACGGSSSAASDNAQASDSNSGDAVTVKLGVVGSIYEDLWTPAKEKLADEASTLSSYSSRTTLPRTTHSLTARSI